MSDEENIHANPDTLAANGAIPKEIIDLILCYIDESAVYTAVRKGDIKALVDYAGSKTPQESEEEKNDGADFTYIKKIELFQPPLIYKKLTFLNSF